MSGKTERRGGGIQPPAFSEQLFQRLGKGGVSRDSIFKALSLQRLCDEVMEMTTGGQLPEGAGFELSKVASPARQKQLAALVAAQKLPLEWIKELSRLVRNAEKAANEQESTQYWNFYFEVKDLLDREGASEALLARVRDFAADRVVDAFAGSSDRQIVDLRKFDLEGGRGLDVGTSNIVGSARATDGKTFYNIQRNAFLDVRSDTFTTRMLMKLGVDHVTL